MRLELTSIRAGQILLISGSNSITESSNRHGKFIPSKQTVNWSGNGLPTIMVFVRDTTERGLKMQAQGE